MYCTYIYAVYVFCIYGIHMHMCIYICNNKNYSCD